MESIIVAACDLDKTLYPPAGPHQASQLRANIEAMGRFEDAGGFVFPVTGNNLLLAQRKFMDPANGARQLRDLRAHPGIYLNGGMVLGPSGKILEKHALGRLILKDRSEDVDFVTGLLDFVDDERNKAALLQDVGLMVLAPDYIAGYDMAYSNVDGYAQSQNVAALKMSRSEILAVKEDLLLILFLFRPLVAAEASAARAEYETFIRPHQVLVQQAMQEQGLMNCAYASAGTPGVGDGIKVTIMKDPWPEMDFNVAGVDKGGALVRFLGNGDVLAYLGCEALDPAEHVAVFGDAPNDVSMFRALGATQPKLRVAMPHADDETLIALANVRAEVSEILTSISDAKKGLLLAAAQ